MTAEHVSTDPRVRRSRRVVLDAALGELAEHGYGAFTIDAVATRSGVARSTIYRHWPDRAALVANALEVLAEQPRRAEGDRADPRRHIEALVRHLADVMAGSTLSSCLPALIDGAERDAAVRTLHHGHNDRRRAALVTAIADAIAAGEVRADVDPELGALALAGAVVYRRVMTSGPFDPADVGQLIETVLGQPPD